MLGGVAVKKEEILQAAILQYANHGYQGATMKRIADEVGIKPASIYFFYENKEKLFIAAFQHILENHHHAMKKVLAENLEKPVAQIFPAMLQGIVDHHTSNMAETSAYISLVTAPVPEIKNHIQSYLISFNEWMMDSLENAVCKDYPAIEPADVDQIIKQYVLLGNGIFWGINLYDAAYLKEQVELAEQIFHSLFHQLDRQYN